MQAEWVIIDGYSLLHRDPGKLNPRLESARHRLIRRLEALAGHMAPRITVVFDGRTTSAPAEFQSSLIEVLFSPGHLTADSVIERMVCGATHPAGMLVVTSDRRERDTVMAAGGQTMSSGDFLDQCAAWEKRRAPLAPSRPARKTGPKLGDFFPPG